MKWLITALSILFCAAISLCFAYKAKLDEANRYIQQIEKGTNTHILKSEDVNIRSGRGGTINIIAGDGK